MKIKTYSFYSNESRAFVNVRGTSKKNVAAYAREILKENISLSEITIIANPCSHAEPIEITYPELF